MADGRRPTSNTRGSRAIPALHGVPLDMDTVLPPADIDTCVRFSVLRCCMVLVSLVLVATDIPRTGLGLRSLANVFAQVCPNTFMYFGPYAYAVARIYKHETSAVSTAAASTATPFRYTAACDGDPIENIDVWSYKFDTLSIPLRALAEHLNVSAYPPCVLYREACREDTLPLETVFAMNDALITALRTRTLREPHRSPQLKFTTRSLWVDRLHHAVVKFITRHTEQRFHSVQYHAPGSQHIRTNVCDPSIRAPRPEICYHSVKWHCDHPQQGSDVQVLLWEHLALRLQALQRLHPDLVFDLTFVSSRTVLERTRVMYLPNIYYITDNIEMTTLIRGRACSHDAQRRDGGSVDADACTTVLIDDYRYERATVSTDSDAWYFITSALRCMGQVYIWVRILCLWVGCYCARAAEPTFRGANWRTRVVCCVTTLAKIPSFVVVYSSWVPATCYAAAHSIDCAMLYMWNEAVWNSSNGLIDFRPTQYIVVASIQMRNIWFFALFVKLATALHHQLFEDRARRWMPVNGVVRVHGLLIGSVSALTVCGPLRIKALRDASITSFAELPDHVPIFSGIDIGQRNPSEYGFKFDLKLLAIALCLLCAVAKVALVVAPLLMTSAPFVVAVRSHFVPFSADTVWSRGALAAFWRVRPKQSKTAPSLMAADAPRSKLKRASSAMDRQWRSAIVSCFDKRVTPADIAATSTTSRGGNSVIGTSDTASSVQLSPRMRRIPTMQSISECRICLDKLDKRANFRWQAVQGCPTHDSLAHLELRTKEQWSIARLKNIAMMTDPLVLLRLLYVGQPMYIYRAKTRSSSAPARRLRHVESDTSEFAATMTDAILTAVPELRSAHHDVTCDNNDVGADSTNDDDVTISPRRHNTSPKYLLLPCVLRDIQESFDAFHEFYDDLPDRWELVACVDSSSLPWTVLVSCG